MTASESPNSEHVRRRASRAVASLADRAVGQVTEDIYLRYGEVLAVRGAKGRVHTERDLRYHIEFLGGALTTGAPVFFTDYVRWLATVLESRGVPIQTLDESLTLLRDFFEQRLEPELAAHASDMLDRGRRALADAPKFAEPLYTAYRPADLPQVTEMTGCLIDGDVAMARSLAQECWEASGDYVQVATRLFQPSLYDVGQLWQRNQITVAQEHLATAICQTLLTQFYLTAALFAEPTERSAVFAAVETNQHVLGLRVVADAFELNGWSVQYLGANTPIDDLVAHVDGCRPDLLGLSASMVQQLPILQRTVERLRGALGAACPTILVGGLPTNQMDRIWTWIGADAWSPDAATAVAEAA